MNPSIIVEDEYLTEKDIIDLGLEEETDDMGPSIEDILIAKMKRDLNGQGEGKEG